MADDPLDPGHLFEHVQDATYFEIPRALARMGEWFAPRLFYVSPEGAPATGKLLIPQPFQLEEPILPALGQVGPIEIGPLNLQLTKYMILEVAAAVIVAVIFIRLAVKMRGSDRPRGRFWNMFEAMLLFIRDNVARPAIGKHDADRFLPFLWTMFFFVLTCNLLGMVPWAGSPTGALATTATLALLTFGVVLVAGMAKMGPVGFWVGQVPHMDLPLPLAIFLKPMIFAIELLGLVIKHGVLAVRLLANMMAGHIVMLVLITFVGVAATVNLYVWLSVAPVSVLAATGIGLLELFVAFLQAYIFAFLSALFIGMAVHPH